MSDAGSAAAVRVADVSFSYKDRRALDSVGFEVQRGECFGFLGPNGSGKSTLFKLLSTIVPMQQGAVTMLGHDLAREAATIRQKIGVVFQSPAVDRKLTVAENLKYAGLLLGLGGSELQARSDEALQATSLTDRRKDPVGELSGGLRRRVEIAKCLLARPELVLLDEASTGLDPAARREMWQILRQQPDLTVLFTTHLMDEAAEADRLVLLDDGKIVAAGQPGELMAEVGGQVLEIETADAAGMVQALKAEMQVEASVVEQSVRIDGAEVHQLVPKVMQHFGDRVRKLLLAHPSLEDVFMLRTGKRFVVQPPEDASSKKKRKRRGS